MQLNVWKDRWHLADGLENKKQDLFQILWKTFCGMEYLCAVTPPQIMELRVCYVINKKKLISAERHIVGLNVIILKIMVVWEQLLLSFSSINLL